ncbi:HDOD domain-containing protein [Marinomonas agarivorans]|nr:HDOD domain-containing protein [Marinomonas agarivorans]
MSNKSPSSLEEWLIFLQHKKFPVAADHLKKISRHLTAPDEAIDKMQKHIAGEPFVGFMTISVANKMVTSNRGDIKTPIHAASMIGMNGLLKITQKLYPCTFARDNKAHQEFLRQQQISYEAATIAKYWSMRRPSSHSEDVFWTTFYRDAVRWLLWFYAYNQMTEMTESIKQGKTQKEAEEDIFGCRIDQLSAKMFQHWNMPSSIINTYMSEHVPNVKELKELAALTDNVDEIPHYLEDKRLVFLANNDLLFSACATKVAQLANQNSWRNKTLDVYYRAISTALHTKHSIIVQTTHVATVEAAKLYSNHTKVPLACDLLAPYLYGMGTKIIPLGSKKKVQAKKAISSQDKTTLLLNQLSKQLSTSNISNKDVLIAALKSMRSLLPAGKQALILSHSHAQSQLKTSLQYGFDKDALKQSKWNANASIMKKLMSKRSVMLLDRANLVKISKQLPKPVLMQAKQTKQLILASCPHKNGDWTILWISTPKAFSSEEVTSFKRILQLVSKKLG